MQWTPSPDVRADVEDFCDPPEPEAQPDLTDFDPDAIRAQIDTGAFATCTDQLHMLHDYKEFTAKHPSPIKLLPATDNSDAVPQGYGYLHVPAHNVQGFLAVRTFYHPSLRTTVIDERDLIKAAGHKYADIASEQLQKYNSAGTFTYRATHKLKHSNDVIVHGILNSGKCYTNALIPPDLPRDSANATAHTSSTIAIEEDPEFKAECERATILAIHSYQEMEYSKLRSELYSVPQNLHQLPFHEYIQKNTPVDSIKTSTERLLWHQRLCHPSDYYLYNAHKHVDGVPRFAHMDRVLDICPTCVRSKQTKEPAGPNTTRVATEPYQGLSIDFSFSGTRSKNTSNKFPIGTRIKKKFERRFYQGTVVSGPNIRDDDHGVELPHWRVKYDDGDSEEFTETQLDPLVINKPVHQDAQTHRDADYIGLNGETSWILVTDHFSRMKHGDTRVSKASPIEWLRHFLQEHAPACPGKCVYLDQGGELYNNPEVKALFARFGYEIRVTGADASNQNGPVERGHGVVANAIRAILLGADLPIKFWPYAFHHWLRIDNSLPSKDQELSPHAIATGKRDDFSAFRTFGCRVWVRPPGRRQAKFRPNSRKGIFLGFLPNTDKNIVWYDPETDRVKTAKHARFDEGMNDLPADSIPPNVVHLQRTQNGEPLPAESDESIVKAFTFSANPFSQTLTRGISVTCDDPTFGIKVATDELNNRAYVTDIAPKTSAANMFSSHKATLRKVKGAYIVSVNGKRVFTKDDAIAALRQLYDDRVTDLDIELAPERKLSSGAIWKAVAEHNLFQPDQPDDEDHTPTLSVADVRAIAQVRYPDVDFSETSISSDEIEIVIGAIQSQSVTPAEQAMGRFTRRKLKTLNTWDDWRAGEHKQLDQFHTLKMFGPPTFKPPGAIVLRPHWQYSIKRDGTRRSRNCCDGSPRSAPVLHGIASTYSSCVEQPVQRLFFALAAQMNYTVYGGDAIDAYAHSPPPETPTFVSIDDAYVDWYEARFKRKLDRSKVLPVLHALQGHPESGTLWEKHITAILKSPGLDFRGTTHDRSIYSATMNGAPVLLLRQVDDFALAVPNEAMAQDIYGKIGKRLQLPSEETPPFKYLGVLRDFNGLDVHQYDDSIMLSCEKYIDRVLQTHMWTTPSEPHPSKQVTPLPTDAVTALYKHIGPAENTPEHAALVAKHGFAYRTLLGELLYAYVTCRPDIGYATISLSKFSTCPHDAHFTMLKKVAKYLRSTKHWGIIYRKPKRDPNLPASNFRRMVHDPALPDFPRLDSLELSGFLDAAHANDLRNRRSTTGYAFILCGGAVSYRCKTQSITATSSTEAEFLAAVTAAKHAKYLRAIMTQLGFPPRRPAVLHCDNQSAINMINARVPTERSRHIDIQHFAIQDWKESGAIVMQFIHGVINPSDDLTKPLGWVLHERHARRIMGHY